MSSPWPRDVRAVGEGYEPHIERWSRRVARPFLEWLRVPAGVEAIEVRPIDVAADFRDLDDYWSPFRFGQGPAPGHAVSLR